MFYVLRPLIPFPSAIPLPKHPLAVAAQAGRHGLAMGFQLACDEIVPAFSWPIMDESGDPLWQCRCVLVYFLPASAELKLPVKRNMPKSSRIHKHLSNDGFYAVKFGCHEQN